MIQVILNLTFVIDKNTIFVSPIMDIIPSRTGVAGGNIWLCDSYCVITLDRGILQDYTHQVHT